MIVHEKIDHVSQQRQFGPKDDQAHRECIHRYVVLNTAENIEWSPSTNEDAEHDEDVSKQVHISTMGLARRVLITRYMGDSVNTIRGRPNILEDE